MRYHFIRHILVFLIDIIEIDLLFDDNSYRSNLADFIELRKDSFYFSMKVILQLIMRLKYIERGEGMNEEGFHCFL